MRVVSSISIMLCWWNINNSSRRRVVMCRRRSRSRNWSIMDSRLRLRLRRARSRRRTLRLRGWLIVNTFKQSEVDRRCTTLSSWSITRKISWLRRLRGYHRLPSRRSNVCRIWSEIRMPKLIARRHKSSRSRGRPWCIRNVTWIRFSSWMIYCTNVVMIVSRSRSTCHRNSNLTCRIHHQSWCSPTN